MLTGAIQPPDNCWSDCLKNDRLFCEVIDKQHLSIIQIDFKSIKLDAGAFWNRTVPRHWKPAELIFSLS